jgi:riboflavin transporter FmnP
MKQWFKDWTPLPPDMVALIWTPIFVTTIAILTSTLLWPVLRSGVLSLFLAAVAAGVLGSILLFFARLPLYRRGQFLSFGPRKLDARHRKLYWRAYVLIAASVITMITMLVVLR